MGSRSLIVVGNAPRAAEEAVRIAHLAAPPVRTVAPNRSAQEAIRAKGGTSREALSYLTADEIHRIGDRAARLFDVWGAECAALQEVTEYKGVSLWVAMENAILRRDGLYDALALRTAARRIVEREEPEQIWLVGRRQDLLPAAIELEALRHGLVYSWCDMPTRREKPEQALRMLARRLRIWLRAMSPPPRPAPPKKQKPRVVFLPYTSRHTATLRPVVQELRQRESFEVLIVAAGPDAQRRLREAEEPFLSLWAYETLATWEELRQAVTRLTTGWSRLQQDKTFQDCLAAKDQESIWPLLRSKLGQVFDTRLGGGAPFAERFLEAAHYVDLSQAMLAHLSPDLLVVMNELNVLGRTAVLVARTMGVRSLHVQHGIMADRMLWGKLYADHIAVWGKADQRRLISAGVPSERIAVTGNPRFDHLAEATSSETVNALLSSLGLQANRPIILVTTQNDSLEANRQQLSAIIHAAASFPQHEIVVKLHPAEAFAPYRRMLRELQASHLHLVRDVDLFALLEASVVLITRYSTTGLEAMLKGKPVITLNFSGQPDRIPYAESGAALGVHRPEELLPALEAVLKHPGRLTQMRRQQECFVREYAFRVDGRAAERIADLISEVATA